MFATEACTLQDLARHVGLPEWPVVVDVRLDDDAALDPRRLPASLRHPFDTLDDWADTLPAGPVVVVCERGLKLSQGVAARLRCRGHDACNLAGGFRAWAEADLPLLTAERLGRRWVTRRNARIDRLACPWAVRRFVEPAAEFLFVDADQVDAVAERFAATPFDVNGAAIGHHGEACSFDALLDALGLGSPALTRLAMIVRAADTGRPELAPETPGLLLATAGLVARFRDDLERLDAAMGVYDSLYAGCLAQACDA